MFCCMCGDKLNFLAGLIVCARCRAAWLPYEYIAACEAKAPAPQQPAAGQGE